MCLVGCVLMSCAILSLLRLFWTDSLSDAAIFFLRLRGFDRASDLLFAFSLDSRRKISPLNHRLGWIRAGWLQHFFLTFPCS
ncbi:hypothetical protein BDV19DRAFT_356802 [Aspergillus venezuelensis]